MDAKEEREANIKALKTALPAEKTGMVMTLLSRSCFRAKASGSAVST